MHRKIVGGILAVLALATLVLAGCGGEEQRVQALEPATLRFGVPFGQSNDDPLLVAAVERFQEEYPQVTVELISPIAVPYYAEVDAWVEARQLDLLLRGPDPTLVTGEQHVVLSLEPFISEAEGYDEEGFLPHLLEAFRWRGGLYAIPADVDMQLIYYNRDMFDAQGVAYPQSGWDWQDFLSIAEQLTTVVGEGEQQTGHWGFVSHPNANDLLPFILQHGNTVVDEPLRPTRLVLDDPLVADAMQWYADLGLVHEVMPIVEREQVDVYSRVPMDKLALQQAAMAMGGVGDRGGGIIPWNFEWGAVELPCDQASGTVVYPRGFYITARTEHPHEVWALVRYLSESEQAGTGGVPARRSVAESDGFRQRVGSELADAALSAFDSDARNLVWYSSDPFFYLYRELDNYSYWVIRGDDTGEEFVSKLQDSLASWSMEWP
jgi:ABC-type glycerol-3-phosphate transport system substrate-binding protein